MRPEEKIREVFGGICNFSIFLFSYASHFVLVLCLTLRFRIHVSVFPASRKE